MSGSGDPIEDEDEEEPGRGPGAWSFGGNWQRPPKWRRRRPTKHFPPIPLAA